MGRGGRSRLPVSSSRVETRTHPLGVLGAVAHDAAPQDVSNGGAAHGGARVAAVGLLNLRKARFGGGSARESGGTACVRRVGTRNGSERRCGRTRTADPCMTHHIRAQHTDRVDALHSKCVCGARMMGSEREREEAERGESDRTLAHYCERRGGARGGVGRLDGRRTGHFSQHTLCRRQCATVARKDREMLEHLEGRPPLSRAPASPWSAPLPHIS
jgi:hypothetical protein